MTDAEADQDQELATGQPLLEDDLRGVFPRDGVWGHKVVFDTFEERHVYGFLSPRVSEGELFGYQMESGKIGVFRFAEIDHQRDPRDMFFADVEDVGYLDDLSREVLPDA